MTRPESRIEAMGGMLVEDSSGQTFRNPRFLSPLVCLHLANFGSRICSPGSRSRPDFSSADRMEKRACAALQNNCYAWLVCIVLFSACCDVQFLCGGVGGGEGGRRHSMALDLTIA